jgi:hypothetical protein
VDQAALEPHVLAVDMVERLAQRARRSDRIGPLQIT